MAENNKFSLQCKRFFLTYSKCSIDKITLGEWLFDTFQPEQVLVGQELHEDGTPHLHCYLAFTKAKRVSRANYFDYPVPAGTDTNGHPNIEGVKHMKKCITYCTKEDKDPYQHNFDYKAVLAGKSSKFATVAQWIMDGESILDINTKEPGFVLQHKRKLEEYQTWVVMKRPRQDLIPWVEVPVPTFGPERDLALWLNANLFKPRPLKTRQLYLFSPPNCGKTTLVQWLSRFCRVYYMPLLEDFYDFYDDDCYDLVVIDEFRGQKQIQFLNQWLDGQTHSVRIKGGQRLKARNLPTIILSNWALPTVYSGAIEKHGRDVIGPLEARLQIVSVNKFIEFYDPEWIAQNKPNQLD